MKKKGFTLIELLVVIAIIAMLLAILMPALNKVKRLAQRLVCATNLKGQGTAMMVYANDDKYEQYPKQGGTGSHTWDDYTAGWQNINKDWSSDNSITAGASLFLLVREADVDPKSFVCKSSDQKAFEGQNDNELELIQLWDFGHKDYEDTGPKNCVSYAFQLPYVGNTSFPARPANQTASAQFALMADRNPWFDTDLVEQTPDQDNWMSTVAQIADDWTTTVAIQKYETLVGNSNAHNREGQNVLFNDGHAEFEKRPDIAVQNDNIYTVNVGASDWDETDIRQGSSPRTFTQGPKNSTDNYLINDVLP